MGENASIHSHITEIINLHDFPLSLCTLYSKLHVEIDSFCVRREGYSYIDCRERDQIHSYGSGDSSDFYSSVFFRSFTNINHILKICVHSDVLQLQFIQHIMFLQCISQDNCTFMYTNSRAHVH